MQRQTEKIPPLIEHVFGDNVVFSASAPTTTVHIYPSSKHTREYRLPAKWRCVTAVRFEATKELSAWSLLLSTVQPVSVPCPAPTVDSGWGLPGWLPAATGACAAAEAGSGTGAGLAAAAA